MQQSDAFQKQLVGYKAKFSQVERFVGLMSYMWALRRSHGEVRCVGEVSRSSVFEVANE
jgi:hypothetical protein